MPTRSSRTKISLVIPTGKKSSADTSDFSSSVGPFQGGLLAGFAVGLAAGLVALPGAACLTGSLWGAACLTGSRVGAGCLTGSVSPIFCHEKFSWSLFGYWFTTKSKLLVLHQWFKWCTRENWSSVYSSHQHTGTDVFYMPNQSVFFLENLFPDVV